VLSSVVTDRGAWWLAEIW